MADKGNKKSLFWISYSDLMTSLFFTIFILFVVVIIAMYRTIRATEAEIAKIKSIESSIEKIDPEWFEYNDEHKKHILNIDVSFPINSSNMENIPDETREKLRKAGNAIVNFLDKAEEEYGDSVQYLLVIEGQASRDNFAGNDVLSYERALSFYNYLKNNNVNIKRDNCEVLICGSGQEGVLRFEPDNAYNEKNQRFLIHILPKPGVIKK